MPLPLQQILSSQTFIGSDAADLISNAEPDDVVNDITFHSMVGCIKQLSELVHKSGRIFSELQTLTASVNGRLDTLTTRTGNVTKLIDGISISPSHSFSNEAEPPMSQILPHILQVVKTHQLISKETIPESILELYEAPTMHKMPAFVDLDVFKSSLMNGANIVSIAFRYSNPDFFLKQWCQVQESRMKKLEAQKARQKYDKKERKAKNNAIAGVHKKKASIAWQDRYMVDGQPVHRSNSVVKGYPAVVSAESPALSGGIAMLSDPSPHSFHSEVDDNQQNAEEEIETKAATVSLPVPLKMALPPMGKPPVAAPKADTKAEPVPPTIVPGASPAADLPVVDVVAPTVVPVPPVTAAPDHKRHVSFDVPPATDSVTPPAASSSPPPQPPSSSSTPLGIATPSTTAAHHSRGVSVQSCITDHTVSPFPDSVQNNYAEDGEDGELSDTSSVARTEEWNNRISYRMDIDSDDDPDFDPDEDYRSDPQYDVQPPLVIDLTDTKRVFVSPSPMTIRALSMRNSYGTVKSNATLHYSSVYKSTNVSTRVPPGHLDGGPSSGETSPVTGVKADSPPVPPPGKPPVLVNPSSGMAPLAANKPPMPVAATAVKSASPPPPPPPPGQTSPNAASSCDKASPPKPSPPPPVTTSGAAASAAAAVSSDGRVSPPKPPPPASPPRNSVGASPPPPPGPPAPAAVAPPAAKFSVAFETESNASSHGDGESPAKVSTAASIASSIFGFRPVSTTIAPTPASTDSSAHNSVHYLDGDEGSNAVSFAAIKMVPPRPPPPPMTVKPPQQPQNPRQSQRLLPVQQMPSHRQSQRLLVKSIRLSSNSQPVSFYIESQSIADGSDKVISQLSSSQPPVGVVPPPVKPAQPPVVTSSSEAPEVLTIAEIQNRRGSAPPAIGNIFAAIRQGGQLKKVDVAEEQKKKADHVRAKSIGGFGDSSVAAILERRKFLEAESSGSDSDENEWE